MKGNPMGRPIKSHERRVKFEAYVPGGIIDILGDYVAERKKENKDYSRSDFVNEALEKHMKDLGLWEGASDEEKQG